MEVTIRITVEGSATEKELLDFVHFELIGGSLPVTNPFYEGGAEITEIEEA